MKLIGTSFGKCLRSLAAGEVRMDDVFIIVAGTQCSSLEELLKVAESYHTWARVRNTRNAYDTSQFDLVLIQDITTELWYRGKIYQPRNYAGYSTFVEDKEFGKLETWIALAPSPKTDDPRVVDAYERYLVMRNLLQ